MSPGEESAPAPTAGCRAQDVSLEALQQELAEVKGLLREVLSAGLSSSQRAPRNNGGWGQAQVQAQALQFLADRSQDSYYIPQELLAGIPARQHAELLNAIEGIAAEFNRATGPGPVAEGHELNGPHSGGRGAVQEAVMRLEASREERPSNGPGAMPRLARTSGTHGGAGAGDRLSGSPPLHTSPSMDKAVLIQSMLNRPKMSFRDIVQIARAKARTDPASLGYGEGGSIPALDFMTDPPPQEEAGRAGAGASALPLPQGASFQRNTYRGPTANFATVQEEGDMSEEFATQSQQGGSSSGDQGSGSNHPNGEGPAGGAAQRRNSSGPALAPSPKKSTGGTPEAGAGNAAPVSSGDRKSPVGGLVNPLYTLRTSLGQTSSDDHAVSPATRVMRDMNMAWPAQGPRDLEAGGVAPQAEGAQAEPGQQDNSGYPRLQAQPASGQQQLQGGLVGATGREKKRNSSVSFHATEPPLSGRDSQTGHIKPSSSSAVPGPDDHGYDEDVGEEDEKAHALQVANESARTKGLMTSFSERDREELWKPLACQPTRFAFEFGGRRYDVGAKLRYYVIDIWTPSDPIRVVWDMWMLLMLMYVIICVPYLISFDVSTGTLSSPISYIDLMVNVFFLLDVYLNFRTAYPDDDGNLVTGRKEISVHYLKGWFWLDFFSSLPYDLMFGSEYGLLKLVRVVRVIRVIKVLRVLRMLKLLRMLRMKSFLSIFEDLIGRTAMRMSGFVLTATVLLHWAACLFHFVTTLYPEDARTWVTVYHGEKDEDGQVTGEVFADNAEVYVSSLYWAVTTMATVGYGDIVAVTIAEKVVAMGVMLLGASIFGYFMGSMATIIAALNSTHARMARKKAAVDDFLRHRKIPRRLSEKIRSYYSYIVEREVHADEADIITGLSTSLRMQVVLHLYREALEKVPFFRGKHPQFITTLITYLKLEYYSPGDVIVRQGDMGNEMYFIGEGTVEVRVYDEGTDYTSSIHGSAPEGTHSRRAKRSWLGRLRDRKRKAAEAEMRLLNEDLANLPYRLVGTLSSGQYFGEYSCMLGEPRIATVVATSYCELYSLSRADLESVVAEWPELAEELSLLVQDNAMELDAWEVREQMGVPLRRFSVSTVGGAMPRTNPLVTQSEAQVNLHTVHSTPSMMATLGGEGAMRRSYSLPAGSAAAKAAARAAAEVLEGCNMEPNKHAVRRASEGSPLPSNTPSATAYGSIGMAQGQAELEGSAPQANRRFDAFGSISPVHVGDTNEYVPRGGGGSISGAGAAAAAAVLAMQREGSHNLLVTASASITSQHAAPSTISSRPSTSLTLATGPSNPGAGGVFFGGGQFSEGGFFVLQPPEQHVVDQQSQGSTACTSYNSAAMVALVGGGRAGSSAAGLHVATRPELSDGAGAGEVSPGPARQSSLNAMPIDRSASYTPSTDTMRGSHSMERMYGALREPGSASGALSGGPGSGTIQGHPSTSQPLLRVQSEAASLTSPPSSAGTPTPTVGGASARDSWLASQGLGGSSVSSGAHQSAAAAFLRGHASSGGGGGRSMLPSRPRGFGLGRRGGPSGGDGEDDGPSQVGKFQRMQGNGTGGGGAGGGGGGVGGAGGGIMGGGGLGFSLGAILRRGNTANALDPQAAQGSHGGVGLPLQSLLEHRNNSSAAGSGTQDVGPHHLPPPPQQGLMQAVSLPLPAQAQQHQHGGFFAAMAGLAKRGKPPVPPEEPAQNRRSSTEVPGGMTSAGSPPRVGGSMPRVGLGQVNSIVTPNTSLGRRDVHSAIITGGHGGPHFQVPGAGGSGHSSTPGGPPPRPPSGGSSLPHQNPSMSYGMAYPAGPEHTLALTRDGDHGAGSGGGGAQLSGPSGTSIPSPNMAVVRALRRNHADAGPGHELPHSQGSGGGGPSSPIGHYPHSHDTLARAAGSVMLPPTARMPMPGRRASAAVGSSAGGGMSSSQIPPLLSQAFNSQGSRSSEAAAPQQFYSQAEIDAQLAKLMGGAQGGHGTGGSAGGGGAAPGAGQPPQAPRQPAHMRSSPQRNRRASFLTLAPAAAHSGGGAAGAPHGPAAGQAAAMGGDAMVRAQQAKQRQKTKPKKAASTASLTNEEGNDAMQGSRQQAHLPQPAAQQQLHGHGLGGIVRSENSFSSFTGRLGGAGGLSRLGVMQLAAGGLAGGGAAASAGGAGTGTTGTGSGASSSTAASGRPLDGRALLDRSQQQQQYLPDGRVPSWTGGQI